MLKNALPTVLLAFAGLAGCNRLPPSKPLSELTPTELAGRQVFELDCAQCHHATSTAGKAGPGLEGLFRTPYLPDGQAATDQTVTSIILNGHGMMPAFGGRISPQQLQELLAYLHTI